MSLDVTLPGPGGLESPRLEELVPGTSSGNLSLHRDRRTMFGVLTVEHDVGGPSIDNELLLTGRRSFQTTQDDKDVDDDSAVLMNYTAQPASAVRNTDSEDAELIVLYSPGVASALVAMLAAGHSVLSL